MKQTFLLLAQLPCPNKHRHRHTDTGMQTHIHSHADTNTHRETHMCTYTCAPKHAKQELLAMWHQNKASESGWKSRGHILELFLTVLEPNTTCLTSIRTSWLCLYCMVLASRSGLQDFWVLKKGCGDGIGHIHDQHLRIIRNVRTLTRESWSYLFIEELEVWAFSNGYRVEHKTNKQTSETT